MMVPVPSSALDYISIKGFKSIASIEKLELRPINVLIGANGSGKSNFIGVFDFLHAIREKRLTDYIAAAGGAEKVLYFGSKTTQEVSIDLSFSNAAHTHELKLSPTSDDGLYLSDWTMEQWTQRYLERCWVYHLNDTGPSSPMRKTARVDDNRFLRHDASNLAAFLYYLREKHEDSYSLIRRTIQRVVPFFDDFQLAPLKLKPDDIKIEWRHKSSDRYFDVSSLSDGTLRFIALATLFLQPEGDRPSLFLVDEPELGLHPYAIEMLASLVKQASVKTQVIVSTQSSLLLDHFSPEDVLVAKRVDGATEITRPDSAQLAAWLEEYSLGQLWEKNELEGRPAPN
jgi:predicted ATPase